MCLKREICVNGGCNHFCADLNLLQAMGYLYWSVTDTISYTIRAQNLLCWFAQLSFKVPLFFSPECNTADDLILTYN